MLEKLSGIEKRYEELNRLLLEAGEDYQRVAELNKERLDLEPIFHKSREYRRDMARLDEARAVAGVEADPEMRALAESEISDLEPRTTALEKNLKLMLAPKDPRDDKNVFVEIRAGTGGEEAAIFAADLYRMYTRYAERQGWKIEMMDSNAIGVGGFKEVVFQVKGKGAFSRLKYESGVHRVQRVPSTESSGRIHTSTATVAVLAEVEDVDIEIPDSDLKIDVFRSSGAGGQNVQKQFVSLTCHPVWWWQSRTSARSCKINFELCPSCVQGFMRSRKKSEDPNRMRIAVHRLGPESGLKRFARTITPRIASRITALTFRFLTFLW